MRASPASAVPEIVGRLVLTGTAGSTTAVVADVAGVPVPPELIPATATSIVSPTCAFCNVYVLDVAPEIAVHVDPEQLIQE